jgi:hypothetical protein
MNFGTDTRAQSTLVGAILLFAILIIAFSSYQAFVVPNQNAGVEFNHNSEVQTDMQDLRNSLLDVQSVEQLSNGNHTEVSEHRPVAVQLGTQYPARLIALNPPAPSGTIETVEPTTAVRIENATLAESVDEFKKDPNVLLEEDLNTTFLRYSPGYNEYQEPPDTVLEHSLLYNDFGDAKITVRSQTVLRPETNQIHIVLFDGEVSQSGTGSVTLDPETVDGPTTPVPIENDGTLTIQIPTQSPTAWNETIDELDGVGFEKPPDSDDDQIRVTLENGTYDLRVTRVSFDGGEPELSNQLTEIQRVDDGGDGGGNGTLPGPRVTNISTSTTDGSVSPGDSFNLNATISNVGNDSVNRGGTAIQYAEWYLDGSNPPSEGEGTPMNDVKGAYLNDVEVDVGDRINASEDLNDGNNTLVVRANDTRGIWGDEIDRITVNVETFEYDIVSINPVSGGGNDIDVTFEINTTDPDAQVDVQSLTSNGNIRDQTGLISVTDSQPQTVTIAGNNQAAEIRVILYDGDGNEQTRMTVTY